MEWVYKKEGADQISGIPHSHKKVFNFHFLMLFCNIALIKVVLFMRIKFSYNKYLWRTMLMLTNFLFIYPSIYTLLMSKHLGNIQYISPLLSLFHSYAPRTSCPSHNAVTRGSPRLHFNWACSHLRPLRCLSPTAPIHPPVHLSSSSLNRHLVFFCLWTWRSSCRLHTRALTAVLKGYRRRVPVRQIGFWCVCRQR